MLNGGILRLILLKPSVEILLFPKIEIRVVYTEAYVCVKIQKIMHCKTKL